MLVLIYPVNWPNKATIVIKDPLSSAQSGSKFTGSPTASSVSQDHQDPTQTSGLIHGDKKKSIFDKYKAINLKNEILKGSTYTQFWKQTASAQSRLLFVFDIDKGWMQMEFFQTHIPHPKTIVDMNGWGWRLWGGGNWVVNFFFMCVIFFVRGGVGKCKGIDVRGVWVIAESKIPMFLCNLSCYCSEELQISQKKFLKFPSRFFNLLITQIQKSNGSDTNGV